MKAFPEVEYVKPGEIGTSIMTIHGGMDLRDYFAAKFIPEICKHSEFRGWNYEENAKICYLMADAMIEAREK